MKFSKLQKYILLRSFEQGRKYDRQILAEFYKKRMPKNCFKIITRSIERLIDRELLTGFGVRTPHKWFIKEIKLTLKGRKIAKKFLGEQQKLPLEIRN